MTDYTWVSNTAKYRRHHNEKLPWSVDFKKTGYGTKYFKTLDEALDFIKSVEDTIEYPF